MRGARARTVFPPEARTDRRPKNRPTEENTTDERAGPAFRAPMWVPGLSASGASLSRLLSTGTAHARLEISQPDDAAERDADELAEALTDCCSDCAAGRSCASGGSGGSSGKLQRRQDGAVGGASVAADVREVKAGLGAGQPLDPSRQLRFEERSGVPLDGVRVHTDERAAASARAVGALAYTLGPDVVFARGRFAPHTTAGESLLAHEIAHVVLDRQARSAEPAVIHRQSVPTAPVTDAGAAPASSRVTNAGEPPSGAIPAPSAAAPVAPVPHGEVVKTVDGIQLIEDEEYMDYQMRQLGAREGTDVPHNFYARLIAELEAERAFKRDYEANPAGVSGGVPLSEEQLDAEARVISIMQGVMQGLNQTEISVPHEFEERAKETATETLDSNEKEARAEAFRYGIDWKTVSVPVADCLFGDCTREATEYAMGGESPAVTGLQAAANILLPRRQELDRAKIELDEAQKLVGECEYGCDRYVDAVDKAERDLKKKGDAYALLLGYLGETYPILAALGDPDRSADDLADLTKQKAGPAMAAFLGKEIVKRLTKIKVVREGLSDPDRVNIWRLPILVGLTKAQMGIDDDPFEKRVIDERVESEKPGILESLALLVLNIGALLLAAPTGGASLVVAAGVNAAVAVEHVKEYVMQSALAGTAFDKAKGLSRDEPSLFWLAVEVVGVAVDAFAAFKAVSEAVKVVEAAKEVGDAAKEARALEELRAVARENGGEELVSKVLGHFGEHPTGESEVLKAIGVGEEEAKALRSGEQLAKEELEVGAASGKAAAAGGPAKVSRLGHIFSCSSPCTWMREKYAALLGPDVTLEGETTTLRQQYLAFEERAVKAAEDVRLAKEPGELAKAEEAAAQLEKEIADFDRKLSRELSYRKLEQIRPEQRFRLSSLNPDVVISMGELDPAAAKRVLELAPDAFSKVTALGPEELKNVARLGPHELNKIAQLDQDALRRFAQLDHEALKYVADLNPPAIEWLSELRPEALEKLASARIASPFSLRKLAEQIGPKTSLKKIDMAIAKAERHKDILEKAFEAAESGDWTKITGKERSSIGRHIGYEIEETARAIASGGRAKQVLNYELVNKQLIAKLEKGGGRALLTQGRLKGGDLRFDIAEIDFDKKTVELIDLAPRPNSTHIAGTKLYEKELSKLLPDFTFKTSELHYVGEEGQVLEKLEELPMP